MEIRSRKTGDALVVSVSGELDLGTAREFRALVDADLERYGCRDLVLDFGEVGFIDSSGLGAILGRYKNVSERGGQMAVCGVKPHVRRLLELSGVNRIIRIPPTVREALFLFTGKEVAAGGEER